MENSEILRILLQTVCGNGAINFFGKITLVSWCPWAYMGQWETRVCTYAGMIFVKFCIPGPIWTWPRPPEPKKNTKNNDAAYLQKVPPFVLLTLQFNIFLRLRTNISALLYLRHMALPYISVLGLYIRLQIYTLPLYRPQISFSSPRNKYIANFSIYGVYCSLKIVYLTYISVPQTDILPIYRLNIISDTLVPRAFRKYSTCLIV